MRSSLLGNVSGLLLRGASSRGAAFPAVARHANEADSAALLADVCERVSVLDAGGSPFARFAAGCAAAAADRVLVVAEASGGAGVERLLALTAWPERDAVVWCDAEGDHPLCAVYRRDAVQAASSAIAASAAADEAARFAALLSALDGERLTAGRAGLDRPCAALTPGAKRH